jgi:putative transposase
MARGRRKPAEGLIHHADRGSQDACHAYQAWLAEHGIRCSMSRQGHGLDNAVAERFLRRVKGERTSLQQYIRRQEARDDVIDAIERFYNSKRWHSDLGYVSPHAFEALAQAAEPRVRFSLTTTSCSRKIWEVLS